MTHDPTSPTAVIGAEERAHALVIDDDPESILLVTTMLEYGGYAVHSTTNFDAVPGELAKHPSVILLDLVMPNKVAERTLGLIASIDSPVPVILMSGKAKDQLAELKRASRLMGVNVAAVIAKPFWIDSLLEALSVALPGPGPGPVVPNEALPG